MISLKDITAGYKGIEVIKNINISFEKGSIASIIGKNGSGKSTLLKTASKLLEPFSGDVMINEESIYNMSGKKLAKRISFLSQTRNIPNITVYNLVMHGRFPYLVFPEYPDMKTRKLLKMHWKSWGLTDTGEKI